MPELLFRSVALWIQSVIWSLQLGSRNHGVHVQSKLCNGQDLGPSASIGLCHLRKRICQTSSCLGVMKTVSIYFYETGRELEAAWERILKGWWRHPAYSWQKND